MGVHLRVAHLHHPDLRIGDVFDLRYGTDPHALDDRFADRLAAADFHHHAGDHAGLRERAVARLARGRSFFAEDHALALELADANRLAPRKPVPPVHEDYDRVAAVRHGMKTRVVGELSEHCDIRLIVDQCLERGLRVAYPHRYLHSG